MPYLLKSICAMFLNLFSLNLYGLTISGRSGISLWIQIFCNSGNDETVSESDLFKPLFFRITYKFMKINTLFRQICSKSPCNLIGIFRNGNSGSGQDIFAGKRVKSFCIDVDEVTGKGYVPDDGISKGGR